MNFDTITFVWVTFVSLLLFSLFILAMNALSIETEVYRIHQILYIETAAIDKFITSPGYTTYYDYVIDQSIIGVKTYAGFFEVTVGGCNVNNILYLRVRDENNKVLGNEVMITNENITRVYFTTITPAINLVLEYKTKSSNIYQKRLEIFIE